MVGPGVCCRHGLCATDTDEARWAATLRTILRAGASIWAIDNAGLSPAYLALGASGCLECLAAFETHGKMRLESDEQIARLYPGAGAVVFFRLLREMEGRQMLLASALLRMHSARRSDAAAGVEHCSSGELSAGVLQLLATLGTPQKQQQQQEQDEQYGQSSSDDGAGDATVTFSQLRAIESPWRRRWFSLLLSMGLDPNLREAAAAADAARTSHGRTTTTGQTLLHFASRAGFLEITELLLESGADPQAVDDEGATALHLSAAAGHWEITQLLLEKGAALTAADRQGRLPYHHAGYAAAGSSLLHALRRKLTPLAGSDDQATEQPVSANISPDTESCRSQPRAATTTVAADGWGGAEAEDVPSGRCDIEVVDFTAVSADGALSTLAGVLQAHAPVLLRGVAGVPTHPPTLPVGLPKPHTTIYACHTGTFGANARQL